MAGVPRRETTERAARGTNPKYVEIGDLGTLGAWEGDAGLCQNMTSRGGAFLKEGDFVVLLKPHECSGYCTACFGQ